MGNLWIRSDGGIWNNDADANPTTGVGGFHIEPTGLKMYVTAVVDVGTLLFNFGSTAFIDPVPSGFTGWRTEDLSGFTTFDPATMQGNGTLANGDLNVASDPSISLCQTRDGWTSGRFYWEWVNEFNSFFTTGQGSGIQPATTDTSNVRSWFDGAGYNGGSLATSPQFAGNVVIDNVTVYPTIFVLGNGTRVGMAVDFGFDNPFQNVFVST